METGEITCDMGIGADGCWMGDYCMPAGSVCPEPEVYLPGPAAGPMDGPMIPAARFACPEPTFTVCDMATGEIVCDMGMGPDGCWMGDYCMPAGSVCPEPIVYETATTLTDGTPECFMPPPSVCDMAAGEVICDMGWDTNGCWMGDYCMPTGSVCPDPFGTVETACPMPPPSVCDTAAGEIFCDMGFDTNGCWMGDYCMPAGSVCPEPANAF